MRKLLYFSCLFLALGVALTLSLFAVTEGDVTHGDSPTDAVIFSEEPATEEAARFTAGKSYLLLGVSEAPYSADLILVGHVDEDGGAMKLLELPANTVLGERMLGEVFAEGANALKDGDVNARLLAGVNALADFLEGAFGLTVDGYAALTGEDFADLVDSLGGIPVSLPHPIDYQDPKGRSHLRLKAGDTTLSGKEARALALATELVIEEKKGATNGERFLLGAFFKKLRFHSTPKELAAFIKKAHDRILTDITLKEALLLGGRMLTVKNEALLYADCTGERVGDRRVIPKEILCTAAAWLEGHYDREKDPFRPCDDGERALYEAPAKIPFTPKAAKKEKS